MGVWLQVRVEWRDGKKHWQGTKTWLDGRR
jgi:hypothetical protein